jgi:methylmalonyl-CoA mutase C-terminal domain/subunit
MARKIRILIAKPGLDGHDRGAKVIARTFLDAGMEVIYTGLHQSPNQIVSAAVQEDADVIALSILSGAHMSICRKLLQGLEEMEARDKVVIVGGTIVEEDIPKLKEMGVSEVFPPGSPIEAGAEYVKNRFKESPAS